MKNEERLLDIETEKFIEEMTTEKCFDYCRQRDAIYAGLKNGMRCRCGSKEKDMSEWIIDSSNCNVKCRNGVLYCGSQNGAMNIYKITIIKDPGKNAKDRKRHLTD